MYFPTNASKSIYYLDSMESTVEKTSDVEYQSLTSLKSNEPVEFYIPPSTDDYYDLKNSKLLFSFRIKQANGANCDRGDLVAPINDMAFDS